MATLGPDATQRLALGIALAEDLPVESALTLQSLLALPQQRVAARAGLGNTLIEGPVLPGLRTLYLEAASTEPDTGRRYALRARGARATDTPEELESAVSEMERLLSEAPTNADAILALGDVQLRRGDLRAARDAFIRDLSLVEAREALVLIALVDPNLSDASWWAQTAQNSPFADAVGPALGGRPAAKSDRTMLQTLLLGPPEPDVPRRLFSVSAHDDLVGALSYPSHLRRGTILETYGYPGLAERALNSAAEATGTLADEVAALHMLGRLRAARGDKGGAIDTFRKAVKVDPSQPALQERLVVALLEDRRIQEASAILAKHPSERGQRRLEAVRARITPSADDDGPALQAALAVSPADGSLASDLATWLEREGRVAEAKAPLAVVLDNSAWDATTSNRYILAALAGDDAVGALAQAQELMRQSGTPEARDTLARVWLRAAEQAKNEGRVDDAVDAFAVGYALNPQPSTLRMFGGALWSTRPNDALTVYGAAVKAEPANRDGIDALVKLAVQTGRQAETRELLKSLEGVTEIREALTNFDLLGRLSDAERAREAGRLPEAERGYRGILEGHPDNAAALRGLGSIALERGREAEAAELFERARALTPEDVWSRLNEANGLIAVGQWLPATQILDELAQVEEDASLINEVRLARGRLHMQRAIELHEAGRFPEAFEAFETSLQADPASTWTYTNLGNLYAANNQYDLARAAYLEAQTVDPTNMYALTGQAHLHIDRGQLDTAAALLEGLPPGESHVRQARSRIELVRITHRAADVRDGGDPDAARTMIQAARDRYPTLPAAQEAWEEEFYGHGTPELRYASARRVLAKDPTNRAALEAALEASRELGNTDKLDANLAGARAIGGERFDDLIARGNLYKTLREAEEAEAAGAHAKAVQLVARVDRDTLAPDDRVAVAHTWIALNSPGKADTALDAVLTAAPSHPGAALGKVAVLDAQGQAGNATSFLEPLWQTWREPEVGLELARRLQGQRQRSSAATVVEDLGQTLLVGPPPGTVLPPVVFPSGRTVEPFPADAEARALDTRLDAQRRSMSASERSDAHRAGLTFGPVIYARPGFSGKEFLTSFLLPIRVHTIGAGPVSFDIEAVGTMLSDTDDTARGVMLSAGLQADAGPVAVHLRGGVSPLGFTGVPYALWAGSVDVAATPWASLGAYTRREPVADTLTSWAGKEDASGEIFGRVHRTSIGGRLRLDPERGRLHAFGEGGWNEGLGIDRNNYWLAGLAGGGSFSNTLASVYVGADTQGMGFDENHLGFERGEGGYLSPQLFVDGSLRLQASVKTRNDRFHLCAGGRVGAQYLEMDTESLDPDVRVQEGLSLGYDVTAGINWRMGELWWLGIDYNRESIATTWVHDIGMLHLHFGPNNAWDRSTRPALSPLAGMPIRKAQHCQ